MSHAHTAALARQNAIKTGLRAGASRRKPTSTLASATSQPCCVLNDQACASTISITPPAANAISSHHRLVRARSDFWCCCWPVLAAFLHPLQCGFGLAQRSLAPPASLCGAACAQPTATSKMTPALVIVPVQPMVSRVTTQELKRRLEAVEKKTQTQPPMVKLVTSCHGAWLQDGQWHTGRCPFFDDPP